MTLIGYRFVDLDLSVTINDSRYELDACFIKHHTKHCKDEVLGKQARDKYNILISK